MLASTDDLNKKLTVEQFYNDRTRTMSAHADFDSKPSGVTPTVYMRLLFGDLPEQDRVSFTCGYGAYLWDLMDKKHYIAMRECFIASCQATVWSTNVPGQVSATARMLGKPDPAAQYIKHIQDESMPLSEHRTIMQQNIIMPLMKADASDPDIRYLQTLLRNTNG